MSKGSEELHPLTQAFVYYIFSHHFWDETHSLDSAFTYHVVHKTKMLQKALLLSVAGKNYLEFQLFKSFFFFFI